MPYNDNVFLNCPFDAEFKHLQNAIVFAIFDCGFTPRCALEISDNGSVRFENIKKLIADSRFGVHDISRTELDTVNQLPRFNMPLELGVFIGASRYGRGQQKDKSILILDKEPYRYQKFISDIAGQDIRIHANEAKRAISHVRNWLSSESKRKGIPGGTDIFDRFEKFNRELPDLCAVARITPDEVQYNDYATFVSAWLNGSTAASS
jgi:hypothetical protein